MLFTSIAAAAFVAGVAVAAPAEEARQLQKRDHNSDNWCGAVKTAANFSDVEATWTVPAISIPINASKTDHFSSYQWISLGGTDSCPNNGDLLQAGTGAEIDGGDPFYYAYYQLFGTGGPMVNRDLTVSPGDSVFWKNLKTGVNSTKTLESATGRIVCNTSAEWIHERPGDLPNRRPFPVFTDFAFTGISATSGTDGSKLGLSGATDWILWRDNTDVKLCHTSHTSSTAMNIVRDKEWFDLPQKKKGGHRN